MKKHRSPRSGRAPLAFAVLAAIILALSGCGGADQNGAATTTTAPDSAATTAPPQTAPTSEPTTPSTTAAPLTTGPGGPGGDDSSTAGPGSPAAGTFDDPIPLGRAAPVGQWEITVAEAILDADDIVLNHSEFNPSPQPGNQFVLVKLQATRTAGPAARFAYEVFAQFAGIGGTAYDEAFGDIPDPLAETSAAEPGDSATGYLLFEAPSAEIAGGLLRLFTEALAPDDKAVFFALE
jgi:hypothetical protein